MGTQWGVGHGGFHTQEISSGLIQFHLIYDCGSKNAPQNIHPQIRDYVNRLVFRRASQVDLVVVSHFDLDHVSGLHHLGETLREANIQTVKIIAPLLTPMDRVLLALRWADADDPADYLALIADPVQTLTAWFATEDGEPEVIQLDSDGEGEAQQSSRAVRTGDAAGVTIVDEPSGEPLWELVPHIPTSTDLREERRQFEAELATLLDGAAPPCDDPDSLRRFVQTHRVVLRLAIESTGLRSSNASSICLYSGPIGGAGWTWESWWGRPRQGIIKTWHVRADDSPFAWLGTGDAPLRQRQAVRSLADTYGPRLNYVRVFGSPHHGSDANSGAELWDALPSARVVTFHGPGDRVDIDELKHPGRTVLAEASRRDLFGISVARTDWHFNVTQSVG